MKIRKNVVAWIGMIVSLLIANSILVSYRVSDWCVVIPGAFFIAFLVFAFKAGNAKNNGKLEELKLKVNLPLFIVGVVGIIVSASLAMLVLGTDLREVFVIFPVLLIIPSIITLLKSDCKKNGATKEDAKYRPNWPLFVVAWLAMIPLAWFVTLVFAGSFRNILALLPAALFLAFLAMLYNVEYKEVKEKEKEKAEETQEAEETNKEEKTNVKTAWCLFALIAIVTLVVMIFAGWFFFIPLIALLAVTMWLAHINNWPKLVSKICFLAIIIAVILFGVFLIVATTTGINGGKFDTIYVDNLVVDEDLMVNDDLLVNGDLAVNNDVVVNQGNIELEKGDVNVNEGNVNVDKGDVNVNEGNVNVDKGDVNVNEGDVNVDKGDVNVNEGDVNVDKGDVNVNEGDVNVENGDVNVGGDINIIEPPATNPPATNPPATEPPATNPPATEPPATNPPATEPPVLPSFELVASGDGWWEVKFEGMNSADIVLDNASKGNVEWLSANSLKVTKTCEGTCYFSLTDNVSGEVIYLF